MFFRIMTAALLLTSCAPDSGPSISPVDLVPSSLSAGSCLDLGATFTRLRSMGPDTSVRLHTTSVDVDGKGLRRNFVGEIAYANFRFSTMRSRDAEREWPNVTQNGCESVVMSSGSAGDRIYKIIAQDDPSVLKLERDDGYVMQWKIEGPRQLSLETTAMIMDRCPEYVPATATTRIDYTWGAPDEVAAVETRVSRAMLRAISMVVVDMPVPLLTLATFDTEDDVKAPPGDLAKLPRSTIDPEMQNCPYRAEPPSGAEPPPPPPGTELPAMIN